MAETLVILPTFNEAGNVGALIESVFAQPIALHVLVIDDNSPDGTATVVRGLQERFGCERLQLLVREGKNGRGTACLEGYALARKQGYTYVVEMDADFSHDPADIPRMLAKMREAGADVVIGSKRMKGSRIVGWPIKRHVLSWSANKYLRFLLRVPVSDCTNGYRLYGPRSVQLLPDLKFEGNGLTIIHQEIYQLYKKGMRFAEVPTVFTERRDGTSNMSIWEINESFFGALKSRSHLLSLHFSQGVKFCSVGLFNTFLDLGLLALFVEKLALPLRFAVVCSGGIAITSSFLINKFWTFRNNNQAYAKQYLLFIAVYLSSLGIGVVITVFCAEVLGIYYIIARIIALPVTTIWNYLWSHFQVFRPARSLP